jgi:prepilin-type N-terminal cleavage/methylation domain-containing protein
MKITSSRNARSGLTLIELLVVIALIAIVVSLADPFDHHIQVRGAQTKALSNAKQIALALKLYASDHNGEYPSFALKDGKPNKTPVTDSNTAFAQLFPDYVQVESIFWLSKSAFCSATPPDEIMDNPALDTPVNTLKKGENEWACVVGLNDKSNPAMPLITSGFASAASHTYSKDPTQRGGVWKGLNAIVVHVDGSGSVAKVDPNSLMVIGSNGDGMTGDIFTTANAANGWLTPSNPVVNPR